VIDKARNYDVVMINEAHHVPRHRLFTKSLLRELYDAGYRYLCLEALHYEWNIEWNLGNYTGAIHNGYYTKESCFAELIREAAFAGYTIYGYEPKEITSLAGRDSMMAVYLNEIFQQDTAAKIIVHAGYGHISRNLPKSMYNYFVSATGKSVLTVDQTLFRERANDFYESVYNVAFNERFKVNSPTVLVDSSGKSFRRGDSDIYVYQPHTTLINNRPDWLYEQGNRQAVKVKGINRPSVIKAYYAHEVSISDTVPSRIFVPADAIVIEKLIKKQKHFLVLPKGIFLIQYHDMHGNIYKKYYCRVK
jgi:hypothetical protein